MNSENIPWSDYPRPQLKREIFKILNGEWKLNDNRIIVPFPPQSELSEYEGEIHDRLEYRYEFYVPDNFVLPKILLHFGAVDQICEVWLNNEYLGDNEGGYLPFSFDITDVVKKDKENILLVKVVDDLSIEYPYGKQSKNPSGMWYTPVSGIWQTVWLENLPERYINNIIITPDMTGIDIEIVGDVDGFSAVINLENGRKLSKSFSAKEGRIEFKNVKDDDGNEIIPILWSVKNPYLYDMTILSGEDKVETYFGLRKIEIKEINLVPRVCLNDEPIFMHGVLDQGYFMDGIFLPESSKAYENDVLYMKELGLNTLRKHIKIEPEQFYYFCDKYGMLVIQDMVNSGKYSFLTDTALPTVGFKKRNDMKKSAKEKKRKVFFEKYMKKTINHLHNHPSVVAYTIFNEGWGQFDGDRMYELAKETDPTRLYDTASGWFATRKSDFDSEHVYFRNKKLKPKYRPMLLSECGGFTYKVEGHLFKENKSYGYGNCKDSRELTVRIIDMYKAMVIPVIKNGLCGCIYTQLSDVEEEINGLYTYDREVCKVEKDEMRKLSSLIDKRLDK
ncbi:MAG: glycoside hydrolase family 2 [Lachnospiraceae bacterium]|nr:glycoside hydrolase family 2 [Lachnospiraceae bacterium]